MKKYLQYEREVTVAVSDTDFTGRIKPSAIMGYCQDVATEHADILKIGYDDMRARGLGWVMIRMSFKVYQSPKVCDVLTVRTFPEKPKSADVNRGYYILNKNGDIIIAASSKWCVLNLERQRIQRCTPIFEQFSDNEFIPKAPFEDANYKIDDIIKYGTPSCETLVQAVQITDLDYNGHMNNARYGDAILNICDPDFLREYIPSRIDINFMSQLFLKDSLEVYSTTPRQNADITYVEAKKVNCDEVVFRGRVEWSKR
ncbi:MAG: thioesterase [Oscillospiraceae bacterium]|nr:thioesterase [Oscillospiraceae bacterium]